MLLLAWSVLVLGLFLASTPSLEAGSLQSARTLGLALLTTYAFWFVGFRVRRLLAAVLATGDDPLETGLLELGLGVAVFVAAWIALGAAGLLYPLTALVVLGVALAGPQAAFFREQRRRLRALAASGGDSTLWILLCLVGFVTLVTSLTPVTSQDALVYHLAIPAHYVRAHAIVPVEGNFFAQFPQNMEMLFTMGLLLDCPPLAQVYHWVFGVACAGAAAQLARVLDPRASGLLAAVVFATIPTVALIAGWAYIDLAVVFFILLSTIAFLRWRSGRGAGWVVLAGLFAGVAAGSKYTAGLQGILVVAGALLVRRKRLGSFCEGWLPALLAASATGLLVAPWLVKNLMYTGNPLYPFCYELFGGKGWDAERARVLSVALSQWGGSRDLLDTLVLPWRLTMSGEFFEPERFDGVIGCVFLLGAPLAVLALRRSAEHRIVGLLLGAYAVFWVFTTRQVRFLLPALACAAALMASGTPALLGAAWPRSATGRVLKAALGVNLLIISFSFVYHNPLAVVLGLESRRQFLQREIPGGDYAVFEYIESNLPADSYIFFGSLGNPGFLCKRKYYADAFFENTTLIRMLRNTPDPDALCRDFEKRGFTHFLFRWDCVFDPTGRKSDLSRDQQHLLMEFLNRHARLLTRAGGTYLYELGLGIGPLQPGAQPAAP